MSLLPEGIRTYTITSARVEVVKKGQAPSIRELLVALTSPEGSGEVSVPLEPFIHTPDGVEMWERIFKSAAVGLGFEPTGGHLPMQDVAAEFASWIPQSGIVGQMVEAQVTHHNSTKLKDDGTPFVNHRVKFRGLLGGGVVPQPMQVPAFAGAGAAAGDPDPWA
jgi:hypothetical protein